MSNAAPLKPLTAKGTKITKQFAKGLLFQHEDAKSQRRKAPRERGHPARMRAARRAPHI